MPELMYVYTKNGDALSLEEIKKCLREKKEEYYIGCTDAKFKGAQASAFHPGQYIFKLIEGELFFTTIKMEVGDKGITHVIGNQWHNVTNPEKTTTPGSTNLSTENNLSEELFTKDEEALMVLALNILETPLNTKPKTNGKRQQELLMAMCRLLLSGFNEEYLLYSGNISLLVTSDAPDLHAEFIINHFINKGNKKIYNMYEQEEEEVITTEEFEKLDALEEKVVTTEEFEKLDALDEFKELKILAKQEKLKRSEKSKNKESLDKTEQPNEKYEVIKKRLLEKNLLNENVLLHHINKLLEIKNMDAFISLLNELKDQKLFDHDDEKQQAQVITLLHHYESSYDLETLLKETIAEKPKSNNGSEAGFFSSFFKRAPSYTLIGKLMKQLYQSCKNNPSIPCSSPESLFSAKNKEKKDMKLSEMLQNLKLRIEEKVTTEIYGKSPDKAEKARDKIKGNATFKTLKALGIDANNIITSKLAELNEPNRTQLKSA